MKLQNKPSNSKTYKLSKWQIHTLSFLLPILVPMILNPSNIQLNFYIMI